MEKENKDVFLLTEIIEQSQLMNINGKVKIKNGDSPLSDGRVVSIDNSNNTWYSHNDSLGGYKLRCLPIQDILIVQDKDLTDLFLNQNDLFRQQNKGTLWFLFIRMKHLQNQHIKKLLRMVFMQ